MVFAILLLRFPNEPSAPRAAIAVLVAIKVCRRRSRSCSRRWTRQSWERVANAWEAIDRPYPQAYARYRQAEAALATRETALAAHAAWEAGRIARALAAAPLLGQIEALARRARLDLDAAPRDEEPQCSPDPFGLTGRERVVLRYLCQGASNRQVARPNYLVDLSSPLIVDPQLWPRIRTAT